MKKPRSPNKPKRAHSPRAWRGSPAPATTHVEPEPRCYHCSKCGLVENKARVIPVCDDYPSARDLKGVRLWQTCPDDGPEGLQLWDPNNPKVQRIRYTFSYSEFKNRVCSPFVRDSPGGSAAATTSYGPACFPPRMQFEWFVQEYLKRKGPAEEVDLANLLPAHRILSDAGQGILRDQLGRWCLSPAKGLYDISGWFQEASNAVGGGLPANSVLEILETALVLYAAADVRPQESLESEKATLYVPFDLRFSLNDQFNNQVDYLRQIQASLLALSGRERVFQVDSNLIKRRFLVHVLTKYGALSSREIGRILFPSEDPESAATKVRNVRRLVRVQLGTKKAPV